MLQYRIMEPRPATASDTDMLVISNHLGASLEDDMSPRAQYFADATGRRVLAYDRPASGMDAGWHPGLHSSMHLDYIATVARTGHAIAKIIEAEGVRAVHVAGQSSAATEAAALVRTETLPANRLTFMDGAGLDETSIVGGLARYARYIVRDIRHNRMRERHPARSISVDTLSGNEKVRRVARQTMRSSAEMWSYAHVYRKPVSRDNLLHIARYMPHVAMNVQLVGNTFTATPYHAEQIGRAIVAARLLNSQEDLAEVMVNLQREAYHSHFDPAQVYAQHLAETYRLSAQPPS